MSQAREPSIGSGRYYAAVAIAVLDRIALHQTRLHTPGLGLDAKGVALGAKGLVLLPSIDRLVAFLAVYTRERSLEDLMPSLAIRVAPSSARGRSRSSSRPSRATAWTAWPRRRASWAGSRSPAPRATSSSTGTRRAVRVRRDRAALDRRGAGALPRALLADLRRRAPHRAATAAPPPHAAGRPSTKLEPGVRIVVAEQGLGPALVHYFVRSRVDGEVGVAEWPPESAFDDAPVRRWIFRIPELPERMRPLMHATPGITCFVPAGPGVAVEAGHRHPVELRACPVFDPAGLVLVRGDGDEPWTLEPAADGRADGVRARRDANGRARGRRGERHAQPRQCACRCAWRRRPRPGET